ASCPGPGERCCRGRGRRWVSQRAQICGRRCRFRPDPRRPRHPRRLGRLPPDPDPPPPTLPLPAPPNRNASASARPL
ncbi:MAG: hypothetical protein AVDCRST_MAG73-1733, partial [uncultured Thermomicrobiales bacterium]